jgi:hypothetical protein
MRRRTWFVDVKVAAPPSVVRLGPEPALKLHEAPDLAAVRADVGLDVGGRLLDGGQVDAEQFRAPLQRCCDWPGLSTATGWAAGAH